MVGGRAGHYPRGQLKVQLFGQKRPFFTPRKLNFTKIGVAQRFCHHFSKFLYFFTRGDPPNKVHTRKTRGGIFRMGFTKKFGRQADPHPRRPRGPERGRKWHFEPPKIDVFSTKLNYFSGCSATNSTGKLPPNAQK
jgi:hypothetical protein